MEEKKIVASNFSRAGVEGALRYIFHLSLDSKEDVLISFKDTIVINEFIHNSDCIEDNKDWLENGGAIEVILNKTWRDTTYRIERI